MFHRLFGNNSGENHFYEYHRNRKRKNAIKKLDIWVDSEQCLKVHTLIYAQHGSVGLGRVILLNVIFHVAVSNYHLVKI